MTGNDGDGSGEEREADSTDLDGKQYLEDW